jgi:hypothetical protein
MQAGSTVEERSPKLEWQTLVLKKHNINKTNKQNKVTRN